MQAAKYIKLQEGCRLTAYVCSGGNVTIGYGTSWSKRNTNKITKAYADRLFFDDLMEYQEYINKVITIELFDYEWVALCDHAYNLGSLSISIIDCVNSNDLVGAADIMGQYIYANGKVNKGLKRRVKMRTDLFLGIKVINIKGKSKKDILCTANTPPTYLKVSTRN